MDQILGCLKNGKQGHQFTECVRCFSFTLYYYSKRAYEYVRSKFNNNLPSVSAIRNWYNSVDGSPGFTTDSFDALQKLAIEARTDGEEILCNLIFDEMKIHKHSQFNIWSKEFDGFVDLGKDAQNEGPVPLASDALVYLVGGVNKHFKIPVAYFLIDGLATHERASITNEILRRLSAIGLIVISVIFDGLPANLSAMKALGADFDSNQAYIFDPIDSRRRIFILLDACHMLKLSRNMFASHILIDGEGRKIEWRFVEMLYDLQTKLNWNFGNKINKTHIQWYKKKMSVAIAAQTLSSSVADSLEFLKSERDAFKDVDGTVKYIRVINNVFDVMNSTEKGKDPATKQFKRPISPETQLESFGMFLEAIDYLKGLKIVNNNAIIPILS